MSRLVCLIALAAACGGSSNPGTPTFLDAGPDAPPLFDITVRTRGSASLIVYRAGSGDWQAPVAAGSGEVTLVVLDDYQLVYVCAGSAVGSGSGSAGALFATELDATVTDGQQIVSCSARRGGGFGGGGGGGGSGSGGVHALSGTMAEAGTVSLGSNAQTGSAAGWAWSFTVPNGSYTLVATDGSNIALREGIAVAGSDVAVASPFDLTSEGSAFVSDTLGASGVTPGATVTTTTQLRTASGTIAVAQGSGLAARYVDPSLLSTKDTQTVSVLAQTAAITQLGTATLAGVEPPPPTFALLPSLAPMFAVTADGALAAQWTSGAALPNGGLSLTVTSADGTQTQTVSATAAYSALHPAAALAFATDATGFLPSWKIDFSAARKATLVQSGSDASADYSTTTTAP